MKKLSDRYVKIVAWDEDDQCYIGLCPGLMLGGVHGSEDAAVYGELCRAIDEWIALLLAEEHQLPPPTSLTKIEALIST